MKPCTMPNAPKHQVWIRWSGLRLWSSQLLRCKVQVCKCISIKLSCLHFSMFCIMIANMAGFCRSMLAEIWVAACFFVAHVYGKATPLGLCLFSGIAFLGLSLFKVVYIYIIYVGITLYNIIYCLLMSTWFLGTI